MQNRKVFKGSLDKSWLQECANLAFRKQFSGLFATKIGLVVFFVGHDSISNCVPKTSLFSFNLKLAYLLPSLLCFRFCFLIHAWLQSAGADTHRWGNSFSFRNCMKQIFYTEKKDFCLSQILQSSFWEMECERPVTPPPIYFSILVMCSPLQVIWMATTLFF